MKRPSDLRSSLGFFLIGTVAGREDRSDRVSIGIVDHDVGVAILRNMDSATTRFAYFIPLAIGGVDDNLRFARWKFRA